MEKMNETKPEHRRKIAFISQPEYFRFIYENGLEDIGEIFEFQLRMGLQPHDFKSLIDQQADYNFFFRGEFVPDGVLEQLDGLKIALSSEPFPRIIDGRYEYSFDSINRYLDFRAIRDKPFDYIFHYDRSSIPFLKNDGMHLSGEFPFPVETTVYKNISMAQQWDLFFIGRSTSHREKHFGYLKHHHNFLHISHGIYGSQLVDYLCSAKICLNIHAENEVSWEPRMQMMLACGVFVISEKITPNAYLRPGIDYIEIKSPQELHEKVHYYLHNDDERLKISKNGYDRIREVLDSKACFKKLLSDLDQGNFERFAKSPSIKLLDHATKVRNNWRRIKNLSF